MVGIVSESDLILGDEEADLHLPLYLNIMGGVVFLGSMKGFEKRLDKAFATKVSELMTADPEVVATTTMPRRSPDGSPRRTTTTFPWSTARAASPASSPGPTRWPRSSTRLRWRGRSPGSTSAPCERNCARLKPSWARAARAVRRGQGRRLRPRRRRLRRRGARRAARRGWRWRPPPRRSRSAARFPHVPLLTMGALTPEELDAALGAGSEVSVWREGFLDLVAERARRQGRPARVHVKHDSGMGRLGNRDPARVLALARACAADANLELAGVWTHFATADEPDSDFFDDQLDRFSLVAEAVRRRVSRGDGPRRQQRRRLSRPALALRHGSLRRRDLRPRPVPGRPRRARPRAGALAALLRRRRQALRRRRQRRLRADLAGAGATPASACCRSATATGSGAGSPTTPRCWSAAAATRWSARSRWTTSRRPRARDRRRARRRGGADRLPGRRGDPRRGAGPPARHDQLRDHLRDLGRGSRGWRRERALCRCALGAPRRVAAGRAARAALARRARPGSPAAPSATPPSAARSPTSTSPSPAIPRAAAQAVAASGDGHAFELSAEFATWRAVAARRRLAGRRHRAARRDDRGRPGARATSRSARSRCRSPAASRSIPTAASATSSGGSCGWSASAASAPTRCGCCARPARRRAAARDRPGTPRSPAPKPRAPPRRRASASSPSCAS